MLCFLYRASENLQKKLSKPGKSVNSISKTDFPQKFISKSRLLHEKEKRTRTRMFRDIAMSVYAARIGDFVEHFCRDVSGLSGEFCDALSAGLYSFCCRFCCRSCRLFVLVVLNYLWTGSSKKARFVFVFRGSSMRISQHIVKRYRAQGKGFWSKKYRNIPSLLSQPSLPTLSVTCCHRKHSQNEPKT